MNRYIPVEKLITEIERFSATEFGGNTLGDDIAKGALDYVLEEIIPSLQQEKPEVDLEKEMTAYIERHFHIRYDETLEVGNDPLTTHDFEEIARHFAEWGAIHLNARKK